MKLHKLILGSAAAFLMAGCVSEDITGSAEKGVLSVGVTTQKPYETRADQYEVTNFPVTIYKEDGTTKVESYESVADMPAQIRLDVGTYVLEAHTPGTMQRQMTEPYYMGTATSEIIKNVTTQTTIVCKQMNGSIKVNYDAEYLALFTAWTITFDDGNGQALAFTNANGTAPSEVYWAFGDNVSKLTVNFRGTTTDGNTVTASKILTKSQATTTYDGDTENFGGGDAVVVNFTPVEATSGKVTIGITATITFDETVEDVLINVVDNGNFKPDTPDDPTPGDDPVDNGITLNLPNNMTVSAATDKSLGDTYIKCEKGIKSIRVAIVSTSSEMIESLGDLNTNYGVDFIGGAEIVGNQDVVQLFQDLNQPLSVPAQGDIDYTFPIGNFFGLLGFLSGQHTFNMVVEDMEGNKKNGTLTLTVE